MKMYFEDTRMNPIASKALELWDTGSWSIGEIAEQLKMSNEFVIALLDAYAPEELEASLREMEASFFENRVPEFDW